jgi:signal transduction histidine kinase
MRWWRPVWRIWTGAALTALGIVLAAVDGLTSDKALFRRLERQISRDWQADVRRALDDLYRGREPAGVSVLEYNYRGDLLRWNDHRYVPENILAQTRFFSPRPELVIERNLVHYAVKLHDAGTVKFVLFPVRKSYPIRNQYLSDFVYLGRYNDATAVREAMWRMRLSLAPVQAGVNVVDEAGEFVFGVLIQDATPFRRAGRMWAVGLTAAGLALLFWGYARWVRAKVRPAWRRELAFFAPLILLRLAMYVFRFPAAYLETELFSSRLLALHELLPSLGDLTLNLTLAFAAAVRWRRYLPPPRASSWYLPAALAGLPLLFAGYLAAFHAVVSNSRIYYEFTDLSHLNVYSFLLYYNAALASAVVFGVGKRWVDGAAMTLSGGRARWMAPAALLQGLGLLVAFSPYVCTTYWLWLLTLGRADARRGPVHVAWILSVYALTTHLAAALARDADMQDRLTRLAMRHSAPRDFATEAALDEVVESLLTDASLWFADTVRRDELVSKIINNHLLGYVKGYDFRAFLFDSLGRRLDQQYEHAPFAVAEGRTGGRTLSRFFRVYERDKLGELYVGRVVVPKSRYGPLSLQIELHPKATEFGKLYPRLLMDEPVRQRTALPHGFELALYRDGVLAAKYGEPGRFLKSIPPSLSGISAPRYFLTESSYELVMPRGDGRVVMVRAPRRDVFDHLTGVSLLLYFYMLLLMLWRAPRLASPATFRALGQRLRHSLVYRIQFLIVALSLAPVVVVWALSSSLFKEFYYREADTILRQNMEQTAEALAGTPGFFDELRARPDGPSPAVRKALIRYGDLLSCDVNVYTPRGRLFATTRPRIFHTVLASEYINPAALAELLSGNRADFVVAESIGALAYFSGYYPLYDDENRIRGILNIPYLARREALDYQFEQFIAYLLNVYLFLVLFLIFIGIFFTGQLTRPLALLRDKLRRTAFARPNEKLEWTSKDEIGALIAAYNQMLEQLEESRRLLAKTEREGAWREMARQVAHEIKNPLTPMKLGVQQLRRVIQTQPERAAEAAARLAPTLLAQIDLLTQIANSFSQFASLPPDHKEPVLLNRLVDEVVRLYQVSEEAEVVAFVPPHEIWTLGQAGNLSRVLGNLVKNALQAMPDDRRGRVELRLEERADEAVVVVKDNGVGIPVEIQYRVFEPNFSTKTSGMGLGLAITRRIVENHGGEIEFISTPGRGTEFIVRLPRYEPPSKA